uniref:Uncharacterized protein n=1 Tax=Candidatus Kentrum sp. FW TaxID=2126338 RepID=A0A450THE5_9GAMM|nr:MAG: hypothetical protein BECKFW1821C_GA0114237_101014 [Candidatus Kentron sp. FW]
MSFCQTTCHFEGSEKSCVPDRPELEDFSLKRNDKDHQTINFGFRLGRVTMKQQALFYYLGCRDPLHDRWDCPDIPAANATSDKGTGNHAARVLAFHQATASTRTSLSSWSPILSIRASRS